LTIRAVLFDFAGVLTSSPWAALAAAGGGDLELVIGSYEEDTDHPWHQVERGEMTIVDWMTAVKELGEAKGVEVDFSPLAALLGEMTVHDPIVDHVRALRDQGYKLALVTNNVREGSAAWRSMVPVDELFDVVIDSSEVGMRKPNPAIYLHALEALGGVPPEEAVFLDDSPGNVEGAKRAGLHAILVETPEQAIEDLSQVLSRRL
jgi:putative hydrolase of the HAD superfamily